MSTATETLEQDLRLQKQDIFNRRVSAFIERYAPRSYEGRDFEHEFRSILMDAFRIAQEPFVYELKTYKDAAVTSAMIRPR